MRSFPSNQLHITLLARLFSQANLYRHMLNATTFQYNVNTLHDNMACKKHILCALSKSLVSLQRISWLTEQVSSPSFMTGTFYKTHFSVDFVSPLMIRNYCYFLFAATEIVFKFIRDFAKSWRHIFSFWYTKFTVFYFFQPLQFSYFISNGLCFYMEDYS